MVLRTCHLGVFQVGMGAKREQMTFGFYPRFAGSFTGWPAILIALEPSGGPKGICMVVGQNLSFEVHGVAFRR